MVNTFFATTAPINAKFSETSTTAKVALGTRVQGSAGSEWVYVQASAAITSNFVVFFTTAFAATMLSTSNDARGSLVGVPSVAFASGEYGWVQVKGATTAQMLASAAANVRLNTTATAGALDDDGTAGSMQVQGIYCTTANGGSAALTAVVLNAPFVDVTL